MVGKTIKYGLAAIAIGVGLFFFFRDRNLAKESNNWPSVEGIIVQSEVDEWRKRNKKSKFPKYITTYDPEIRYEYEIDGKSYTNSKIDFRSHDRYRSNYAKGIVAKYPVGKKVEVFYDPSSPVRSVLETGY